MAYRVDITARAGRNLRRIYQTINAVHADQARIWFNGLEEAVLSLDEHPARCPPTPENKALRHLLYGSGRDIYRIIFAIDEPARVVTVIHIRHGARRPISGETPE